MENNYGKVNEQLFSKRRQLSCFYGTQYNLYIYKKERQYRDRHKNEQQNIQQKNCRIGTVSNKLLRALTDFTGPTSHSASEVVQNTYLVVRFA